MTISAIPVENRSPEAQQWLDEVADAIQDPDFWLTTDLDILDSKP